VYGVPTNLDLSGFLHARLDALTIGKHQIIFSFSPCDPFVGRSRSITVESTWEYRTHSGHLVDAACEHADRSAYHVHKLLGRAVSATRLDPPRSISLVFDDGSTLTEEFWKHVGIYAYRRDFLLKLAGMPPLTIVDDSKQYESFQIQPGDIVV
jgi:hypothetical protein